MTTREHAREATADRVLSIAETLAHEPYVTSAAESDDPSSRLQPYALTVMTTAEVDFITIMDRDRSRCTHPEVFQPGRSYIGSIDAALAGHSHVEEYVGTLGDRRPSARHQPEAGEPTAVRCRAAAVDTVAVWAAGERW